MTHRNVRGNSFAFATGLGLASVHAQTAPPQGFRSVQDQQNIQVGQLEQVSALTNLPAGSASIQWGDGQQQPLNLQIVKIGDTQTTKLSAARSYQTPNR